MSEYIYRERQKSESSRHVKSELVSWVRCEEVIRCRECANFNIYQSDHEYREPYRCHRFCSDFVNPDGFCAWAERRKA